MKAYKEAMHSFGEAGLDLSAGTFEMLFVSGYTVDDSDGGDKVEDDIGGTIEIRETLSNVSWANRSLDADDFEITDPGGGSTCNQAVLLKKLGSSATNRLVAYEGISLTLDGTNDNLVFHGSGIFTMESN